MKMITFDKISCIGKADGKKYFFRSRLTGYQFLNDDGNIISVADLPEEIKYHLRGAKSNYRMRHGPATHTVLQCESGLPVLTLSYSAE